MTLALFHPWIYTKGGAEKLVLEWLKRTKFDVEVFTWHYNPEETFEEFQDFEITQLLPEWAFKKSFYFARGMITGLLGATKKIPDGHEALIVSETGIAELIMYRNKAEKNIAYVHSPLRVAHPDDMPWILKTRATTPLKKILFLIMIAGYNALEKPAWKKFDAIATNSKLVLNRVEKKNLARGDTKRTVIYPGVDIPRTAPTSTETGETIRIVYLSRLSHAKRQEEAILGTAKLVRQTKTPIELHLAGATSKEKYAQKIIQLAKKYPWVHIHTNIPEREKWELLKSADIGLFTAWNEDFGIVPIEYMATGLPIVGSPGGYYEIADLINYPLIKIPEPPIQGSTEEIKTATAENIHQALKTAIDNIEELKTRAAEARKRLLKLDLSWDRFAREFDSFIAHVMGM